MDSDLDVQSRRSQNPICPSNRRVIVAYLVTMSLLVPSHACVAVCNAATRTICLLSQSTRLSGLVCMWCEYPAV